MLVLLAPIYGHIYENRVVTSHFGEISIYSYMHNKGGISAYKGVCGPKLCISAYNREEEPQIAI